MNVLIPVRFPLTDRNKRALERALSLIDDDPMALVTVLHLNSHPDDERVTRRDLRTVVEREYGDVRADYITRDGFLIEEAVLEEASREEITHVVISEARRRKWVDSLLELLDVSVDIESYLRANLDIELVVVP
ncbi:MULTISPECIES: universal stress protein [Halorussus]|uniref:universal stress protein n=1 Tax=Halorussus TaxID=1070314 RepID=UPI0020A12F0B|nr:universal stress protein [Halorussus vallis]USZ78441.1 universal stress protein [Halorussus vallis]